MSGIPQETIEAFRQPKYHVWDCGSYSWVPYCATDNLEDLRWVEEWPCDYVVIDNDAWRTENVFKVVMTSAGHRRNLAGTT